MSLVYVECVSVWYVCGVCLSLVCVSVEYSVVCVTVQYVCGTFVSLSLCVWERLRDRETEGGRENTHVQRSRGIYRCPALSLSTLFPGNRIAHWIWNSPSQPGLLWSFNNGVLGMWCHDHTFMWVKGIQTEVPMLVQQALLAKKPSPQSLNLADVY